MLVKGADDVARIYLVRKSQSGIVVESLIMSEEL